MVEGIVVSAFAVIEKGIYYLDGSANDVRLQFLDFATGMSKVVASGLGDATALLSASSDGRTIFYARLDSSLQDLMLVENFR